MSLILTHKIPTIEQLQAPVNAREIASEVKVLDSFRLVKLGIAVVVLNEDNEMLTLSHRARAGEYAEGAIGPSMESFKRVPSRPRDFTESPLEIWQRSAAEELGCQRDAFDAAGLYIASDSVYSSGIMHLGEDKSDGVALVAAGYGLLLRTKNPEHLLLPSEGTEEIKSAEYMDVAEVLASHTVRPGIKHILSQLFEAACIDTHSSPVCIEPVRSIGLPEVSEDIYYYDSSI